MTAAEARFTVLLIAALMTVGMSTLTARQNGALVRMAQEQASASLADRTAVAPAGAGAGRIGGRTVDSSDGVLPGVVVVARVDGRTIGTTVTDAAGEFRFDEVPVGSVDLSFQLSGFAASTLRVAVEPNASGASARIVHQLQLETLAESVTVRADPPPPPPPPPPVLLPVPEHDQASVCGPAMAEGPAPALGTVRSRHDDETKVLFAAGDQLLIDGGAESGLTVGQNFVVRRRYPTALRYGRNIVVMGEHSSGLVQLVSVEPQVSTAVVVYACDEITRGDYLATFEPELAMAREPAGTPAFEHASRILFADEGQPMGITGRMMVIEGGDVRVGQRLTLFRRSRFRDARPLVIGDAVVVAVRRTSATILVERATDVIFFGERGDWAAPQRPSAVAGY